MKSLLDKVNAKLNAQGGFLKAVSVLVGGTVFAQGISIIALPILTRLYSPKDFALLAVYTSIVSILAVASGLRFEIAIPIPENENEALYLTLIALLSNFSISIVIGVIIFFFHSEIVLLLNQPDFKNLIWLVPIGVLLIGIYNTLQYWSTRKKSFPLIAKTRMVQSISGTLVQIVLGIINISISGLIIGQIIKFSAGIRKLSTNLFGELGKIIPHIKIKYLKENFEKNSKFPKFSTFEALANAMSLQIPVIMIAALSASEDAGYLALAMQIMAIPMGFIGGAVSQVYLANAPVKYKTGNLTQYTLQCVLNLMKIGVMPISIICILAPIVIPYIFGAEWQRAGEMMLWMLPWYIMQFITSPVSMSLHITNNQKIALILQIIGLFIRAGGVWVFSMLMVDKIFEYYALSGFIFYILYFIVVLLVIKNSDKLLVK